MEKSSDSVYATNSAAQSFSMMVRDVAAQADKTIANHFAKYFDDMQRSLVMGSLRAGIDFQPQAVTGTDIIYRVGRQKAVFEEQMLPKIHDMDSFYSACIDFVDTQMEQLFFYNNGVLSAHISRDYLRSMVQGVRSWMQAKGDLSPADSAKFERILAYEELGLRSYKALCGVMLKGGDDPSIISVTLKALEVPLTGEHGDVQETPQAHLGDVRACFDGVVRKTGLDVKAGLEIHPNLMLMAATLREIAQVKMAAKLQSMPEKEAKKIASKVETHYLGEALREVYAASYKAEDAAAELLLAQKHADALLASAKGLPEDIDEKLEAIHRLAMLEGQKAIAASEHPVRPKHAPNSAWMKEEAGIGTVTRAMRDWRELDADLKVPLMAAKQLDTIVNVLDNAVDDSAERIMYEGMEMKVMDGLKAYISCVRRETGKLMFGSKHYDADAVLKLSHVERKCDLALESVYAMMPLVMDYTGDAYDNCYLYALSKAKAERGKQMQDFDKDDYEHAAKIGKEAFVKILKDQGIFETKNDTPYLPALHARCQYLAGLRDGRDATSDHSPLTVEGKALKMLFGMLDTMPRMLNDRNKPTKYAYLEPSVLHAALKHMDDEVRHYNSSQRTH